MRHPFLAAVGLALATAFPGAVFAQAPGAALTGLVGSAEQAAMEGVLVSATKAGSNITVTVVTGADGRFTFPSNRLAPGRYKIGVRAVGYELDPPTTIDIPEQKTATQDLKLGKARDLAAQLSNGDAAQHQDRRNGRLPAAAPHQYPPGVRRQLNDAGQFLGGQQ